MSKNHRLIVRPSGAGRSYAMSHKAARAARIYPTLNQATAIQFLDYVVQRLPFQVEVIRPTRFRGGGGAQGRWRSPWVIFPWWRSRWTVGVRWSAMSAASSPRRPPT